MTSAGRRSAHAIPKACRQEIQKHHELRVLATVQPKRLHERATPGSGLANNQVSLSCFFGGPTRRARLYKLNNTPPKRPAGVIPHAQAGISLFWLPQAEMQVR